jgi:flavin reductase (DIM6/NTAB) family NADH-FMN oxidoreductase RutF
MSVAVWGRPTPGAEAGRWSPSRMAEGVARRRKGAGGRLRLEARSFRRVMRSLAAGVSVVTARDEQGHPWGMTATAVCLVSWEPPLLLVCIDRAADCHGPFSQAGSFALNLLRDDQECLARGFASERSDKFKAVTWSEGETGAPILDGVLAHVECRTAARYPAGDHTIFVGEAVGGAVAASGVAGAPLIYFRGAYGRLGPRPDRL